MSTAVLNTEEILAALDFEADIASLGRDELTALLGFDILGYHIIVANISGGKDSQTMLRRLYRICKALGILDRLACVFADLGDDDEWPGTRELAEAHAKRYGLPFISVQKRDGQTGEPQSLLEYIEAHGDWPDIDNRFCTSDMKRGPISKAITMLCNEARGGAWSKRNDCCIRVLNCMGLRAEESPARAKKPVFEVDKKQTGKGLAKHVDTWYPILGMTEKQVWADIKLSGVKHHPIYDMGMKRLSCMFCVLAGKSSVARAAQLNPEGARVRAKLEIRIGRPFSRFGFTMQDAIDMAEAATARGEAVQATTWCG